MDRYTCEGCKQELSRSAFYRHKNFPVCPGKIKNTSAGNTLPSISSTQACTYEEIDYDFPEYATDSTSDVPEDYHDETAVEIIGEDDVSEGGNSDNDNINDRSDDINDNEMIYGSNNSDKVEPAVQQDANDQDKMQILPKDGIQNSVNSVIKTISHIFLFLQLKFRIPDRAIYYFLLCVKGLLFTLLSLIPGNKLLLELHKAFPCTLYGLKKSLHATWKSSVTEYVTCRKCSTLTKLSSYSLLVRRQIHNDIPKCQYIEFPNHPQVSRRQKCNFPLLKQIKTGLKYKLVSHKAFLYNSIIESIKGLINRPGILQLCNKWMNHKTINGALSDITDGKMWKDFIIYENEPFLDLPNNIALALNIDWFNPYKHTQYSIGAVYLTILNLSRTQRYKIENTIIAGSIPGPNEPKQISAFLQPVIDDLIQLWHDVDIIERTNSMQCFNFKSCTALFCL